MSKQKNQNVLAIAIMFFLFFMIAFVTGMQNPMALVSKAQFKVSTAMSQLGNFMNFIAYAFMGIPAGLILKRKGYKFTSLAAVSIGFCGVAVLYISGVASNYYIYLLGALIAGFSMCMLNTVVNPMLNTLGGGGNTGNRLIQFGGSCNSIGATIAPWFLGILIGDVVTKEKIADGIFPEGTPLTTIKDVNPALFIAMGIFALAFIIILCSKIPEPELESAKAEEMKSENTLASVKGAFKHRNLTLGVLAIFVYIGVEVGIPNIANLFLTAAVKDGGLALSAGVAGGIVGVYWFLMLCGRLLGGVVGGKVSSRTMVTIVSVAAIAFLIISMFLPKTIAIKGIPLSIFFMIACGLCTSVMWGAIFNLSVEGLGKYTTIASGIFMTMVFGGGVLPLLQAKVSDMVGFMNSYWLIIIYLVYILLFAQVGSKVKKVNE